jgi:L-aminopeptidase/D-esterase-like protein
MKGKIRIGHAEDLKGKTGCTVFLFEEGAVAGADIRGGASSTRQFDSLSPFHIGEKINAILFAGGSAFGLNSAQGVMQFLEEENKGMKYSAALIPVVPTAIIFDLFFGDYNARPTPEMAYLACKNSKFVDEVPQGSVGAGCGATIGKVLTVKNATKGGFGIAFDFEKPSVIACVVLNCFGDVLDENGRIIAGARKSSDSFEFLNTEKFLEENGLPFGGSSQENSTLSILITDAKLTKRECFFITQMISSALSSCISPFNTPVDGDVTICVSCGNEKYDIFSIGMKGKRLIKNAIWNAVKNADGFGILPSFRDIFKK